MPSNLNLWNNSWNTIFTFSAERAAVSCSYSAVNGLPIFAFEL